MADDLTVYGTDFTNTYGLMPSTEYTYHIVYSE